MFSRKWYIYSLFIGVFLQMGVLFFGIFGLEEYLSQRIDIGIIEVLILFVPVLLLFLLDISEILTMFTLYVCIGFWLHTKDWVSLPFENKYNSFIGSIFVIYLCYWLLRLTTDNNKEFIQIFLCCLACLFLCIHSFNSGYPRGKKFMDDRKIENEILKECNNTF